MLIVVALGAIGEVYRINRANKRLQQANETLKTTNERLAVALREAKEAGTEAKRAAAKAEATNKFLADMLSQAAPERHAREHKITVEEVLDRAAEKIGTAFGQQPEVEAAIRETIGDTYRSLGEYTKAELQLRRALEIHSEVLGPEHPDTLASMSDLALVLLYRGKLDEAEPLLRQVLEVRRRALGPEHPTTLASMDWPGLVRGKVDEAEPLIRQV